jgi:predicted MFS family arabinose efflux permease
MRPSFFYGYVILSLCSLNMVFVRGATGSFSVFYVALLEEFRWSHAVGASIVSLNSLIYALVSPAVGVAFDRLGGRILIPLAGLFMGLGFVFSGMSDSLWELYIHFGIIAAIGQGGLGFVTQNALIAHWFVRRRATAIGLATMGQGLGMLTIVPLAQFLILQRGWRDAFMILGTIILVTIIPANVLLLRHNPVEVGQLPDGDRIAPENRRDSKRAPEKYQWTLSSAIRSFPFWSITVGHVALGAGLFIVYTHIVAYLINHGIEKLLAAFILGLIGVMRIVGTSLWGYVSDRLGREKAYGASILITVTGLACLLGIRLGSPLWFVYMSGMLYGIGHSAGNPTYGAVIGDIFSGRNIGTIFGFLEIGFGIGMAFGSWSGGAIYDLTGSYRWALVLAILCFTVSFLAIQACTAWQKK